MFYNHFKNNEMIFVEVNSIINDKLVHQREKEHKKIDKFKSMVKKQLHSHNC